MSENDDTPGDGERKNRPRAHHRHRRLRGADVRLKPEGAIEREAFELCEEQFEKIWGERWMKIGLRDDDVDAGSSLRYFSALAERIEARKRYADEAMQLYGSVRKRTERIVQDIESLLGVKMTPKGKVLQIPGPSPAAYLLHGAGPFLQKLLSDWFPPPEEMMTFMQVAFGLTEEQMARTAGRAAVVRVCLDDEISWPPADPKVPEGPRREPKPWDLALVTILVGVRDPLVREGGFFETALDVVRDEEMQVASIIGKMKNSEPTTGG